MEKYIQFKLFKKNSTSLDTKYVPVDLKDYFLKKADEFEARIISMREGEIITKIDKKYFIETE